MVSNPFSYNSLDSFFNEITGELTSLRTEINNLESRLENREARIKILEDRTARLEEELAKLPKPRDPDEPFMPTVEPLPGIETIEGTKCDTCGMVFPVNQAMGWVCSNPNCPTQPRCS